MVIRRILGQKGRTTIPFPIRKLMTAKENDVIAFVYNQGDDSVVIRKEYICDGCIGIEDEVTDEDVLEFVDSLPVKTQELVLSKLFEKYCKTRGIKRVVI